MTYVERDQGVFTFSLPEDPDREDAESNNDGGNDIGISPSRFGTTSKGERDEEESDRGNKQNGTDDIELPEQVDGELLGS